MTRAELKQLPYLENEIKMWKEELSKIEYDYVLQSPDWTYLTEKLNISDKTADSVITIDELKSKIKHILQKKMFEAYHLKLKTLNYIDTIDDSLLRQILYYKFVSGMSWNEVADNIGGNNTDNSIKKFYSRYFIKKERNSLH